MRFQIIALTARSVSAELECDTPFFSEHPYDVLLNGTPALDAQTTNVFSLYGLEPDTHYTLTLRGAQEEFSLAFRTLAESVCLDVRRFGAMGDGKTVDTNCLQAAILSCPAQGTVYVPKGQYLTGPLFLKSDIMLYFEQDATLLGLTDPNDYPILPGTTPLSQDENEDFYLGNWEGNPLSCYASLITGIDIKNTTLAGPGILDGNAPNSVWWSEPKKKRKAWRPRTIYMTRCENILFQGITVKNSPSWTVHPCLTDRLRIIDISVQNPTVSPNTDGINPESCDDVQIIGARVSVGDDCIAAKSGKLFQGKKFKKPCSHMTVRNCHVRNGHGAVVVGSDIAGGVISMDVSRCIFEETEKGLRIKSRRGRGEDSIVDDIRFSNIHMDRVPVPLNLNMYYFCDPDGKSEYVWSKEKLPVDEWTPQIGSLYFENIVCENAEHVGAFFYGLPEKPVRRIEMKNVSISFAPDATPGYPAMMSGLENIAQKGMIARNIETLVLRNVRFYNAQGTLIDTENVEVLDKEDGHDTDRA